MVTIIDYGVGNLFSLRSSLRAIGVETTVTSDRDAIAGAERLILPGVGAFSDAMKKLEESGTIEPLKEAAASGTPIMGICLGMQLLLDKSYEYGECDGLGLIPGEVRPIADVIPSGYKIPHIGWNRLRFPEQAAGRQSAEQSAPAAGRHPLFSGLGDEEYVYFVHSYYGADCDESVIAFTDYGADLTAAVAKNNVMGCQFHPEKSGDVGLRILSNFCNL